MMYMGYEIMQLFGYYEVHQDGLNAAALTLDGIKKNDRKARLRKGICGI